MSFNVMRCELTFILAAILYADWTCGHATFMGL